MKTAELTGQALDWAVAKARRLVTVEVDGVLHLVNTRGQPSINFNPSFNWSQGGPIIEREKINIQFCRDLRDRNGLYIHASMETSCYHGYWRGDHAQPLIAAMRCYCASRLGDEVEIPKELL